jgi:hypothetical protein
VVGNKLLKQIGVKPGSPEAYAFTYNNFEELSAKYGKTGGFGQINPQHITRLNHISTTRPKRCARALPSVSPINSKRILHTACTLTQRV